MITQLKKKNLYKRCNRQLREDQAKAANLTAHQGEQSKVPECYAPPRKASKRRGADTSTADPHARRMLQDPTCSAVPRDESTGTYTAAARTAKCPRQEEDVARSQMKPCKQTDC